MTTQDDSAVRMLFSAMIKVMEHAGLSHAQIFEALKGLCNNWWIDETWNACTAFARDWFDIMGVMN